MKGKTLGLLTLAGFLILLSAGLVIAQQEKTSAEPPANPAEVQWLWGEVSSLDSANKTLQVKYVDYDTDAEKQAAISVDEKTTFDNVKSLAEIKLQDTVSIDYIAGADGKNLAKNISVERVEEDVAEPDNLITAPEKVGSGPPSEMSEPSAPVKEESPVNNQEPEKEPAPAENQTGQ
jgi:hypothetical protein